MDIINLYENYNSYFNADLRKNYKAIFELCSKIAAKTAYKLYLIGGIVRDMLLDCDGLDIDITVEGDAIEFARLLEKEAGAKILSIHRDFGTVKVEICGERIDFASTRSETYPKKGHLPKVCDIGCSLEKDVLRRDFTINSLALSLNQENVADLIDYAGGLKDLEDKKIRILHDKSFIDDPTRIIRGLKYASRLGFELEGHTFDLQKEYLKNVNYDMCNKRIKNELKKTFNTNSQLAYDKFFEQGIYKLITDKKIGKPMGNIENLVNQFGAKHPWAVYFGTIAVFEDENLLEKLELTKNEKQTISDAKTLLNQKFSSDFEIYKEFSGKSVESLLIYACIGKKDTVLHYLKDLRQIKLSISGSDIVSLGFKPSKLFSEGFDAVLKEKLKNPSLKKSEEMEIMKNYLLKN